jgi:hypothetical protein
MPASEAASSESEQHKQADEAQIATPAAAASNALQHAAAAAAAAAGGNGCAPPPAPKPRVFKMSDEFLMFKFKVNVCCGRCMAWVRGDRRHMGP